MLRTLDPWCAGVRPLSSPGATSSTTTTATRAVVGQACPGQNEELRWAE